MPKKTYNVKFRLDGILVEVSGLSGKNEYGQEGGLVTAIQNAKDLCLMKLTSPYKGMTLEHLEGRPRVVGVETSDAWPQ